MIFNENELLCKEIDEELKIDNNNVEAGNNNVRSRRFQPYELFKEMEYPILDRDERKYYN
jgi:hypothetical protein